MTEEHRTPLEQLKQALAAGAISQDTYDAAVSAMSAQQSRSGVDADELDADVPGARSAAVGRDNYGEINTGTIIRLGARIMGTLPFYQL